MDTQRIYLLCIWSEGGSEAGCPPLRVVLEEPSTGRRWGFSDPGGLAAFLESEQLTESRPPGPAETA